MRNKKVLIIISCVLLAILAALTAAYIIIKSTKEIVSDDLLISNEKISEISSETSIPAINEDNGIKLVISSPETKTVNTTESVITFSGTSDPAEVLTLNGSEVERGEGGIFSFTANLNIGKTLFHSFIKEKLKPIPLITDMLLSAHMSPQKTKYIRAVQPLRFRLLPVKKALLPPHSTGKQSPFLLKPMPIILPNLLVIQARSPSQQITMPTYPSVRLFIRQLITVKAKAFHREI